MIPGTCRIIAGVSRSRRCPGQVAPRGQVLPLQGKAQRSHPLFSPSQRHQAIIILSSHLASISRPNLAASRMLHTFTCIATPTSWNEDRTQSALPRVTPADIALALSSSSSKLDAAITSSYLMTYLPSNNASFVFTETIKAKDFLGKEGSFITQGNGTFDSSTYVVEGTFQIVDGSGTGELGEIGGKGSFGPAEKGSSKLTSITHMLGDRVGESGSCLGCISRKPDLELHLVLRTAHY